MQHIEIERKFLLKNLPNTTADFFVDIDQYYFKNKSGIWERARSWETSNGDIKWIHTVKRSISRGVNMEDEYLMSKEEFDLFVKKCLSGSVESKIIKKVRHIYSDYPLKWEVDVFKDLNLIVAEIEIPKKTYKLVIPQYIKDVTLLEVTGLKQFNNRNLAFDIKK